MSTRRADICVAAVSDAFETRAEILASPMGLIPSIGARLARRTHSPQLMLSDGVATLVTPDGVAEASLPYQEVFHLLWSSKRHVMMGATQLDAFGNQNISCIGPFEAPKAMLIGMRGAPGNTIYNRTSYWIPKQSARVLCPKVDFVCGIGNDRAAELEPRQKRYHDLHRVISDLAVFGFDDEGKLRVISVHPGVEATTVQEACGFELDVASAPITRLPSADEMSLIETLDPSGRRYREVPA
jgi:acyl CoA:acetate/3-ketoacid CoA transferase beta subunit